MNADGVWSRPEEFVFSIAPPFWQTWWFRIAVALFIIAILYYFIRRREKIKMENNQIALQIAELKLQTLQSQMNPHFIFNSLNSVQKYILEHNPAEGARYLSKFSKLIRKILDNSHHNLLPLHQIVKTLEMYIELESLRFNREFSYELLKDEDDEMMNRKLPPMLLQPFVENAIWHGLMPKEGEKKLIVAIQKKNDQLYCLIEDNGVGREKAPAAEEGHISRGEKMITGMLESLQQLLHVKPKIIITDLNGSTTGTRVEIFIPDTEKKYN
jgi:LytS/YehU family sensor histidine kinase